MKSKFSNAWNSSTKPRKQRKFRANAPLHKKHKFLSANLSKSLRQKYGKRSLPLRKGDDVLIMRGSSKKKKAKVVSVNLKKSLVTLEGMQRTKKDGTKVAIFFHPSSLQIQELELKDSKRFISSNKLKSKKTETQKK
nr:50S ribosomal protein L24P [uncultured archaeon]